MGTTDSPQDRPYYSDAEVANLLGISLGRLRNKLCEGSPLPPRIQPPGCRIRLWLKQGVHDWLAQFTVTTTHPGTLAVKGAHQNITSPQGPIDPENPIVRKLLHLQNRQRNRRAKSD